MDLESLSADEFSLEDQDFYESHPRPFKMSGSSKPIRKVKFDLDLPQVMKVESHHDDAVLDSRGSRGSMQKVPSLSDLSDPESSLGHPVSLVQRNDNPAQVPPLTPGTNKKMTEALKASFASWEKDQINRNIPKDPREWSEKHVNFWLRWAMSEFSLEGVPLQQFGKGRDICQMGKESFLQRTPPFVGDILWEHLEILQKDVEKERACGEVGAGLIESVPDLTDLLAGHHHNNNNSPAPPGPPSVAGSHPGTPAPPQHHYMEAERQEVMDYFHTCLTLALSSAHPDTDEPEFIKDWLELEDQDDIAKSLAKTPDMSERMEWTTKRLRCCSGQTLVYVPADDNPPEMWKVPTDETPEKFYPMKPKYAAVQTSTVRLLKF